MESPTRIEPTRLESPTEAISDLVAELVSSTALLQKSLHPNTAAQLADLVRITNTYYSNLIEGHKTRPREIERALQGQLDKNKERRNLQLEAVSHLKLQKMIDELSGENKLPDPTSMSFIRTLHLDFYKNAPEEMLLIHEGNKEVKMQPGEWRSQPEHDVQVGRHLPPSSVVVPSAMEYFSNRFAEGSFSSKTARISSIAIAHHRFNYIHPFLDGNGRVSRLMSHAMAHSAGIGAQGLWSLSRGLSRGLEHRDEYKNMMDLADTPRQGDLDGRGNLSRKALIQFTEWFLKICVDQVQFMSSLFEMEKLSERIIQYVDRSEVFTLKKETVRLLQEALIRGQFDRGEISRITGMPERSGRRLLAEIIKEGLLASDTPKGPVSLRFPSNALDILFPRLFSDQL